MTTEQQIDSENLTDAPKSPEYSELPASETADGQAAAAANPKADLNRFNDVKVTVSVELGRASVPIHELLQLSVGTVFELNRSVDAPVELIAQGVPLGNGEVVVVDESFAIRIKEIYSKD